MRRFRYLSIVTFGAPAVVAGCFLAVSRLPRLVAEDMRVTVLWAGFGLVSVTAAAASYLIASRITKQIDAARIALVPTLLVIASYGAFLNVEHDLSRIAIMGLAVGLFLAHSVFLAGLKEGDSRYKKEDLRHLALGIRAIAAFFAFVYAFMLPTATNVHPAFAALMCGVISALVAWETVSDEHFSIKPPRLLAAAFGALGVEFYAGLSSLPITALTAATVALIVFVTALTAAILALKGAAPPRRNFAMATALVVLVLATAQWY